MMVIVIVDLDNYIHIFTGKGFYIEKDNLTISHKDGEFTTFPLSNVKHIKGEEIDEG